ncbi:MAG: hypothetical protein ABW150_15740 [Candidatus Thiodiazotropha sp.]
MIGRSEFGRGVLPHEFCREFSRVSSAVALFYILTVTGSSSGKRSGVIWARCSARVSSARVLGCVSSAGVFGRGRARREFGRVFERDVFGRGEVAVSSAG